MPLKQLDESGVFAGSSASRRPFRYAIALGSVVVTLLATNLPLVGKSLGWLLIVAVFVSAWYGGFGPGALATVLLTAIAGSVMYVAGGLRLEAHSLVGLLTFLALGLTLSKLLEALEAARGRTRLHRRWLQAVLTSIGDAVIAVDPEGCVTFINTVAESLTGWPAAEALRQPLDTVFHIINEHSRAVVQNPVKRVLESGLVQGLANHTVLISRDGREFTIADSAAPIQNADGTISGVVMIFRDVTEAANDARERERLNLELQANDQRKNEFLATLAHELRNPLAPVRNAIQILNLKGGSEQPELQWARDMIDRQIAHLARLIDDLMDVSRISRGRIELQRERVALATILSNAVDASRPLIEQGGQILAIDLPTTPLWLDADLTRLSQVFCNLLNNAVKYSAAGSRIHVLAEPVGGEVVVRVRDEGIGIAPEMLQSVFDMFTQVDPSLEKTQGGLGIGLTLVKRLVELHGGKVEARSAGHGTGSEFVVRLPLIDSTQVTCQQPELASPPRSAAPPQRILIVDDNRDAADSLARILKIVGNEIRIANDGLEALRLAEEFRPDVVLLDIGMPKLNGYDAARSIRRAPWGEEMKLIAVTGWGQEADRQRSRAAGFDHHTVKPVDPDVLLDLIGSPVTATA